MSRSGLSSFQDHLVPGPVTCQGPGFFNLIYGGFRKWGYPKMDGFKIDDLGVATF